MSRVALAEMVHRKESTLASWEYGYRRPKQGSLLELSGILGIPIQQLQTLAGHTPEFDWYVSLTTPAGTDQDILAGVTEDEKEEIRKYLHYLRFVRQITSSKL